jgi:hypothetical protein
VTHHVLKWDKYGKKVWQVDSPIVARITNPEGGTFVASIRHAAVVGRCYVFSAIDIFSNFHPPYGDIGVSAYPFDSNLLAVNKTGEFILNELMGLEYERHDIGIEVKEYGYLFFRGITNQGPDGSVQSGDPNDYQCVYPRLP